mmetsp:Transcript_391/g.964  ORF Transcript_391/g.964 Transcript_391/m.964 type:complete len:218 (+) Transcript_391:650-1303(+)
MWPWTRCLPSRVVEMVPPAARMRSCSDGQDAVWSLLRRTGRFWRARTARQSPALAMSTRRRSGALVLSGFQMTTAMAVHPDLSAVGPSRNALSVWTKAALTRAARSASSAMGFWARAVPMAAARWLLANCAQAAPPWPSKMVITLSSPFPCPSEKCLMAWRSSILSAPRQPEVAKAPTGTLVLNLTGSPTGRAPVLSASRSASIKSMSIEIVGTSWT